MDAKPKSNKQKRLENDRKRQERQLRRVRKGVADPSAARLREAERTMREAHTLRRAPDRLIEMAARGDAVRVPCGSGLNAIARLSEEIKAGKTNASKVRPDATALRRLIVVCRDRADLLTGHDTDRYATALLALSAHAKRWVRRPEDWSPRSHNTARQFHELLLHLTSRYDVPSFLDPVWMEGLTPLGVIHQRWYLHIGQGENIRTADDLPIPLTKKQAHLYLQAPTDFDAVSAFRWAQVVEMGGDERLVRSILATPIATNHAEDEFWITVFRWMIGQPMLDPTQHGPIIDYLYNQRFVSSVPNPDAALPGQPRLIPPQANLCMKGRTAEGLLQAVTGWHRALGRKGAGPVTYWEPSGFSPFLLEEGKGETARTYTIREMLSSRDLDEEGRAMGHCVGSYARSCGTGRVSIWVLRVVDDAGRESRLLTLEVANDGREVVQARKKYNNMPEAKELAILRRWAAVGGPGLSRWIRG